MNTTMKALRFGIEIETVGLSRHSIARAIHSVIGGSLSTFHTEVTDRTGRTWQVVPDGSLTGGNNASGEIVSPILTYDDLEDLQKIIGAVSAAGASVDKSCGIHIHIDGATFNVKSATNLVKFIAKQERLLEHALGVHQDRLNRYCQSIDLAFLARIEARPPRTMQELRDAWYAGHGSSVTAVIVRRHQTRYRGLNLHSLFYRGTLEFRYFNGSLQPDEVRAYIHLVLALAANALSTKAASSKRRDFDPATAKYDFRVVLLRLGLIGHEFKATRHQLTKRLAGSAAWKRGRRDRAPGAASARTETTPADVDPGSGPDAVPSAA